MGLGGFPSRFIGVRLLAYLLEVLEVGMGGWWVSFCNVGSQISCSGEFAGTVFLPVLDQRWVRVVWAFLLSVVVELSLGGIGSSFVVSMWV